MAAASILDFPKSWIFICCRYLGAQTHHCTKFCQNRSFHCGDNFFFQILKMAAAAILDYWNREILLVTGVQKVETNQHAKCCQNRSIGCKDIKIFRFLKMAAVRHLGFVCGSVGQPTVSTCGSLSLCKIWLWSIQLFFIVWTFHTFRVWCVSTFSTQIANKIWQFLKSKIAAAAILKIWKFSISAIEPKILTKFCSHASVPSRHHQPIKSYEFDNPRWRQPPSWKVEKS